MFFCHPLTGPGSVQVNALSGQLRKRKSSDLYVIDQHYSNAFTPLPAAHVLLQSAFNFFSGGLMLSDEQTQIFFKLAIISSCTAALALFHFRLTMD